MGYGVANKPFGLFVLFTMRKNFLLLLLAGCQSSVEPGRLIYREDFTTSAGWIRPLTHLMPEAIPANAIKCFISWAGKYSCEAPLDLEQGTVVTRNPWWVDRNSEAPEGAGTLLLMSAFRLHGEDGGQNVGDLDLLDATITARVRVDSLNLPGGSHVYLWFQSEDPLTHKRANFVLLSHPLDVPESKRGTWYEWSALLGADANWQCLGSSTAKNDLYTCDPVATALTRVNVDFGFIAFPALRPATFPADPNSVGIGVLRMDWMEIRH